MAAKPRPEFTVDDPRETASFLLDGLHGLLLRSLHAGRSRRAFVAAAWSLCRRLFGIANLNLWPCSG